MALTLSPSTEFNYTDSELVIGLVGAVGTDFDQIQAELTNILLEYDYKTSTVRISDFFSDFDTSLLNINLRDDNEFNRISTAMDAGNAIRKLTGTNDFMALLAAAQIGSKRDRIDNGPRKLPKTAHILRSLKHPDEVHTLRRIYGAGYFQIGVFVKADERTEYLMRVKAIKESESKELLKRDEEEEGIPYGQATRDTFRLSDFFVSFSRDQPEKFKTEVRRFLNLLFRSPYITPTLVEHGMFLAYAASFRSCDLSRQVGAVLITSDGDVLATGTNEVPKFGGGQYWPGEHDKRDHQNGFDPNEQAKEGIIIELVDRLMAGKYLSEEIENTPQRKLEKGMEIFQNTSIMNVIEFGRIVHAEMEAILSCARTGRSPKDSILFTTTFPCHLCAKHIIDAGIQRVVYVEPYPKSRALSLHSDAITENDSEDSEKVLFTPFKGVAARRYIDLFSVNLGMGSALKRKDKGKIIDWKPSIGTLRVPMPPNSYLQQELLAATLIEETNKKYEFRKKT